MKDVPTAAKLFLGMIAGVVFWPRLLLTDFHLGDKEAAVAVNEAVQMMLTRYGTTDR